MLKEVVHGRQIEPGTGDAVLRVARVSLGWMHSSFEGAGGLEQRKTVYECGGECVRSTSRIVTRIYFAFLRFFSFSPFSNIPGGDANMPLSAKHIAKRRTMLAQSVRAALRCMCKSGKSLQAHLRT